MRLIVLVLSGWLLGSSLVAVEAPPRVSVPPRRVSFAAVAPVDVQVGKLWWDIGLFHPFTGRVSRDAWEAKYFRLMNRACEPGADAHALIAEAVGYLEDPATLLLEAGEGEGRHFLPVLWEMRGEEAWIIGADRAQVSKPCGPLESVNGVPLKEWLTRRLGPVHLPDRIVSALMLASRRTGPFRAVFGMKGGEEVEVRSLGALSELKDPWVHGGWKGFTLMRMLVKIGGTSDWTGVLDLRDAPWLEPYRETKVLENQLLNVALRVKPQHEVQRVVREHRGQYDTDWDRYAHDSLIYNRIGAHPAPNHFIGRSRELDLKTILPPVLVDDLLAEILAGWALPAERNEAARTAYCDQPDGSRLRIRLQSWCRGLQDARHQASYANGSLLTVPAAKALAAATMINFDHYFAFTPEHLQEQVFRDLLALKEHAQSVEEMVVKSGGPTRDVHAPLWAFQGTYDNYNQVIDSALGAAPPRTHPPSMSISARYFKSIGQLLVTRNTAAGFRVGQAVRTINGHKVQELLSTGQWSSSRVEVLDRYTHTDHILLSMPRVGDAPFKVIVDNRDGSLSSLTIAENDYGRNNERYHGPLPSGWQLVDRDRDATMREIIDRIQKGHNLILT